MKVLFILFFLKGDLKMKEKIKMFLVVLLIPISFATLELIFQFCFFDVFSEKEFSGTIFYSFLTPLLVFSTGNKFTKNKHDCISIIIGIIIGIITGSFIFQEDKILFRIVKDSFVSIVSMVSFIMVYQINKKELKGEENEKKRN